jgi:predicted RNA-binding Zn ribbon-like protein
MLPDDRKDDGKPVVPLRTEKTAVGVIKPSDFENRRAVPNAEYSRILVDCRNLTAHRLLVSFTSMMDRLTDGLFDEADRCGVLSEATLLLETRSVVQANRAYIVSAFEKGLRARIDRRLRGEVEQQAAAPAEEQALELVDYSEVEQEIAINNFTRSLADSCQDELIALNARIGFLLGERELETEDNPFGPYALGRAFRDAWQGVDIRSEAKVIVMKMMDSGVVGDVNSVYADLNRHLANLNVLPHLSQANRTHYGASQRAQGGARGGPGRDEATDGPGGKGSAKLDVDLFAMLRDLFVRVQPSGPAGGAGGPVMGGFNGLMGGGAGNTYPVAPWPVGGMVMPPMGGAPGPQGRGGDAPQNPWSGFGIGPAAAVPGVDPGGGGIGVDPQIIASLTRLQRAFGGGSGTLADMGGPVPVTFDHNLLRRLTPQELGHNVDAIGAMTIELVAMLFDFVSSDRQLPDAIKALLFRLQIPVLKAAILDKEFFSRRTHPARLLVNRYAEAGIAWRVEHGTADPLFLKMQEGVARIQAEFTDKLDLFAEVLKDLESFLAEEEKSAEQIVQASADDIAYRERQEVAHIVAEAELDRRINSAQPPEFLAHFLHHQWRNVLIGTYLETGEEGEQWRAVLADLDNLLWSVQPKRTVEDRRELVMRLPDMLARLRARLADVEWEPDAREKFITELVQCHARAVTATGTPPVAATATPVPLTSPPATELAGFGALPADGLEQDQYHELAASMARGMWVEFTEESGVLVFAKLSWVSPLRGKYLFTHRNGLRAFSLTREELAQRFREDSARPVEQEPLLDRAFSDVMSRLSAQASV